VKWRNDNSSRAFRVIIDGNDAGYRLFNIGTADQQFTISGLSNSVHTITVARDDEVDTLDVGVDHVGDGIAACTTDADRGSDADRWGLADAVVAGPDADLRGPQYRQ